MWFNNNSPTTTTAVLLLFVIGAVVAQSRTPGKRPSSSREAAKRPPPQSSSAESSGGAGGDLTDECPEPNGYFADAYQCDKYYECRDGAITEKLCPDGMVFNDYSINHEKCDLPFNIDCSQRSELQKPKPALHCPRQNGYFSHEEANVCDKFYYCVDGKYNQIVCPDGLVYNEKTGICTWPDEAKKKGCSSQGVLRAKRSTPPPFFSLRGGVIQRRYLVKEKPKDRPRIQARVTSGYGIQAQNTAVRPRYNGMFDSSDYDDHDFYYDDYDFKSDENYEDISISELINGGEKKKDGDEDEDEDDEDDDKGGEEEGEDDRRSRERGSRERGGSRESKESKEKGSKSSEEEDSDERGDVDYDYYVYHDYEEGDKRGRSNARNRAGDRSMTSVEEAERRRWEAPRTDAKRLTTFNNDRRTKPIGLHEITTKNKHLLIFSDDEVFKFTCPAVGMSEAQQHPRYADPEDCQYFYVCINGETPRRNGCKRGQVFNDATKNCDWPRNVPECGDWYKGILTDAELEELEHPKPKQRPDSQAASANRRKQSNKYRPHQSSREAPVDDLE